MVPPLLVRFPPVVLPDVHACSSSGHTSLSIPIQRQSKITISWQSTHNLFTNRLFKIVQSSSVFTRL